MGQGSEGDMADPTTSLRMGAAEWGLLLLLALLWAGSFFFYKVLVSALPPLTVVSGRVLIAALLLNIIILARGGRPPADPRLWAAFLLMGLLNNVVPYSLIALGETKVSSGLASILNATTPMFTVVVAQLFTADEKLDGAKIAGLVTGFVGVMVLVGPGALAGVGRGDVLGEVAVLGASFSYGLAGVFGRRFRGLPPITVAACQLTSSACMAVPLCCLVDQPWTLPMPETGVWAALIGLAVPSTAIAYLLFFRILARAGATNVSLVTLLVPVGAVLLGAWALDETLPPSAWAGVVIIAVGLACLDGRPLSWLGLRAEPA